MEQLADERWINDGGHVAPEAVIQRETAVADGAPSPPLPKPGRPRVVIAGGGVAGLETLLALHALAADRVDITLLAPELTFVNRSMAVDQPFTPHRARGLGSKAPRPRSALAGAVEPWAASSYEQRRVVTREGDAVPFDMLVLAIGDRRHRRSPRLGDDRHGLSQD